MTAEEFLRNLVTYEFTKGTNHPPERMIKYDVALAALELKKCEVMAGVDGKGWVCPVCGRVYAPSVSECSECNKNREST